MWFGFVRNVCVSVTSYRIEVNPYERTEGKTITGTVNFDQ